MSNLTSDEEIGRLRQLLSACQQHSSELERRLAETEHSRFMLIEEVGFLRARVASYQQQVAQFEAEQYSAWQRIQLLERELEQRQLRIEAVEQENRQFQSRIADIEQRVSTQPDHFADALGQAIDAIQQGLTAMSNPYVDYGLQELDLQTQVNLHVLDGQLQMRFPSLNEEIAPQNLSSLQLRLRPIPKQQEPIER